MAVQLFLVHGYIFQAGRLFWCGCCMVERPGLFFPSPPPECFGGCNLVTNPGPTGSRAASATCEIYARRHGRRARRRHGLDTEKERREGNARGARSLLGLAGRLVRVRMPSGSELASLHGACARGMRCRCWAPGSCVDARGWLRGSVLAPCFLGRRLRVSVWFTEPHHDGVTQLFALRSRRSRKVASVKSCGMQSLYGEAYATSAAEYMQWGRPDAKVDLSRNGCIHAGRSVNR